MSDRLDSRQRKKKHTEELEKEQKAWHEHRSDLETKVQYLEEQLNAMRLHTEQVEQQSADLSTQVHALTHEKETIVETHTLETGELRKRITILSERLDKSPMTVSSQPSTEFVDFNSMPDLDEWACYEDIMNGLDDDDEPVISQPKVSVPDVRANTTTLVVGKPRKDNKVDDMQPIASSGLLLMLLLYGAIVATKSTGTTAPPMPGMSDEMRAEAALVADDLLSGGMSQASVALAQVSQTAGLQAVPSMAAWIQPDATHKSNPLSINIVPSAGRQAVGVDTLASKLMASSKQADDENAFGLTTSQYNSLTEFTPRRNFADDDDMPPPDSRRKAVAETLRLRREEARSSSVADVYSRSLLWDRIPEHVLQDFRRIVEETRHAEENGDNDIMT